ncbi:FASCICLIN-LIKE ARABINOGALACTAN PROTEIN 20-RELATED [Salix koriyanagi]|uniref:FASCICLIN-LIKE ARABINOGALACTAN PROTEIN 20-RELATED n=1 Tax=Salix koriyanagi TaxID=2511006 RepID=A0A9Q1A005_9ROSI|nr:FASCICLIN-LIKE ARABINOGALACTAN PROTEIN 20-RELATED [Salix koriyanagi]
MINLTRSGDVLVLNGVPLIFPDMYQSGWLVIHGLNQLLMPPIKEIVGESFSELDGGEDKPDVLDFDEYVYGSP